MNALTFSVEDVRNKTIRYLPKNVAGNYRDIPCRRIGPADSQRYLLIATKEEISSDQGLYQVPRHSRLFPVKSRPRLLPKGLESLLKEPEHTAHMMELIARSAFADHISVFQVQWPKLMEGTLKCQICKGTAKEKEAVPEATSLAITNIWGTVVISATCDHHFRKNNGYLADSLCV